jgi:hypothetical protein
MKICPVCNDSFADELRFCDIDGARLTREGGAQDRNKWWSLIGAGLLVGALVISAASIFFLPKARVSSSLPSPQPQSVVAPSKPPVVESAAVTTPEVNPEPDSPPTEAVVPEPRKKDKTSADSDADASIPNPKAAAADEGDKATAQPNKDAAPEKKPDAAASEKNTNDARVADPKPAPPPPEVKKEKPQPVTAKSSDKDSRDKKNNDDKDKKKSGGFLRVFKKIFGKG